MPRLAHVPGDEQQQRGQRRHRQVAEQRRQREHRGQHEEGVRAAASGRARAGADVGRGARDRAGRRDAAEERRDHVADALSASSSASGSCRSPAMPSATTAESSDSIAPSMAIANADGSSA